MRERLKLMWKNKNREVEKSRRLVLIPSAAPSTEDLKRICPQGRGRDAARFSQGLGCPFEKPRFKSLERRKQADVGRPFLWFLSFGRAKERNSAVGPRPDLQIRLAKRFLIFDTSV